MQLFWPDKPMTAQIMDAYRTELVKLPAWPIVVELPQSNQFKFGQI